MGAGVVLMGATVVLGVEVGLMEGTAVMAALGGAMGAG